MKHPYILLVLILMLVILSGSFSLIPQLGAKPLPDFKEPVKVDFAIFLGTGEILQQFRLLFDNVSLFHSSEMPPKS